MSHNQGSAIAPRERCPLCGGKLAGQFERCQHCGGDISWVETEAGMLPCKIGHEAEVVEQVAAFFAERRLQAEKRAEEERLARIRTCRDCNYTADKDEFSPDYYDSTCKRCAKKRAKKTRTWALIVAAAIVIVALSLALAIEIQKTAKEANRQRAASIIEALEQGDFAKVLELDPKNADALGMKKRFDIKRALDAGDFEAALSLDPRNSLALAMKKSAMIKKALADGSYAAVLILDPKNSEALAMKRDADLRRALAAGDYKTVLGLDPRNIKALAMAASQAESDAEALVESYEQNPTDTGLSECVAALDSAETFSPNATKPSLFALRSRIASVLLRSVDDFESDRSMSNLQMARKASSQMSDVLKDTALAANANDRISIILVKRLNEIRPVQAVTEYGVLNELSADQEIKASAKRLIGTKLFHKFLESLSNRNYESAGIVYLAIVALDEKAAQQLASNWLTIQKQDYARIPSSVLPALPYSVLSVLPDATALSVPPITNSIGMKLKLIPAGTFIMGSDAGERFEQPAHQVTLTSSFYIGVHEVTQKQYDRVIGSDPSRFKGEANPVEMVSWEEAVAFCRKLSKLPAERSAGRVYRLPTEAEWEYACRAGTTTNYSFGNDGTLGDYAWYQNNSLGFTHVVGEKRPNNWGLHDMHGNVWEWCQDWFGEYTSGSITGGSGPISGLYRVGRGGSWFSSSKGCVSSLRSRHYPATRAKDYGFRVTCVPSEQ